MSMPYPRAVPSSRPPLPELSGLRRVLPAFALLALSACTGGRASPPSAMVDFGFPAAEPELLGQPSILDIEVSAPKRDLLGSATYDLPVEANSWVEAELDFLVNERSSTIGRWIERGDVYERFIKRELQAAGLPTDLYHMALIESGMLPTARSHAGAVGFWQFMPATGREVGLKIDATVDERMDPVRSTRAAARHLRGLHRSFGDWALAAAAYNAGSGRISRSMKKFGVRDFWSLAERGDLAEETRHYVPRLYAMTVIARDRQRFGLSAPAPEYDFAYDSVHVEFATPLEELARISQVQTEQLQRLNPHLMKGITPDGGYWVWVPAGQGVALQRAYLASDFRKFRGLGSYTVRAGDSLGKLANRSGLSTSRIRDLNPDVEFDPLQIGEEVKLPHPVARELAGRAEPQATPTKVASASPGKAAAASAADGDADAELHVVKSGESLWEIGRKYGVEVEGLQRVNDLGDSTIRPGQKLRIPAAAGAPAQEKVRAAEHVVASGETVWGIARKYDSSVEAISRANSLGGRPIQPGQTLVIPRGDG